MAWPAVVAALPIGFLCVRYTGIFFGMLTLAFGMLAHSFLFKFYHLTGGDSGMRVPRMSHPRAGIRRLQQDRVPGRAVLLLLPGAVDALPAFVMWRIVHSPFGLHLRRCATTRRRPSMSACACAQFRLAAFVISAVYGAIGGAILGFRIGVADPELVYWTHSGHLVFMTVLGGFRAFWARSRGAGAHPAAGPAAVGHAILAFRAGRAFWRPW